MQHMVQCRAIYECSMEYSACCIAAECMSRKCVETSFGFSRETAGAVKIAQLPAWRWWRWKLQMTNTPSLHHWQKYKIKSKVNSKMNNRVVAKMKTLFCTLPKERNYSTAHPQLDLPAIMPTVGIFIRGRSTMKTHGIAAAALLVHKSIAIMDCPQHRLAKRKDIGQK